MEVTYLGTSCVRLRGRDVTVVIDPPKGARSSAGVDVVVTTDGGTDVEKLRPHDGGPQTVSGPGEFEVRGVAIHGLPRENGAIMRVAVDGVRVVALGAISRQLSEEEIDTLGHVDVLVIPVGGNDVLGPADAATLVRALEPAMVVPIRHAGGGGADAEPIDRFAKEMGLPDGWSVQSKLTLTGSSGSTDETRVTVLEARG